MPGHQIIHVMDVVDRGEAHVKGLLSLVKMPEIGPVVAATSTARALQINRDAVRFRMLSALDGDLPPWRAGCRAGPASWDSTSPWYRYLP